MKKIHTLDKWNSQKSMQPYTESNDLKFNIRHSGTKQIRVANCSNIRRKVVPVARGTWDEGMKKGLSVARRNANFMNII